MGRVRFLPKVVTVCAIKETGFDCKNNHWRGKFDNFRLDIISKINGKKPVIMSYTSSWLGSKKV